MKLNSFQMFSLLLCSCLFGIILSAYANFHLVTDREMGLVMALYVAALMTLFARESNKQALTGYLSRHVTEVEKAQLADVKDAHRRQIIALKAEQNTQIHRIQGTLHVANGKVDRLTTEYDWICAAHDEQMRVNQEQQDRIRYLEDERKQNGFSTPKMRLPFSAPASQIEFSDPKLRARLGPVSEVPEAEEQ